MRILTFLVSLILMVCLLGFSNSSAYGQDVANGIDALNSHPPIRLIVDGAEANPEENTLQLVSGRAVISLPTAQTIFPCQSEWGTAGELVLICEGKRIQLFPAQDIMLVNSLPQELEIAPFTAADGTLFLPLRSLAEILDYTVIYDEAGRCVYLNSPGYEPLAPGQPIPAQPAVTVDYNSLPTWGNILTVPGLTELWKGESVITGYFTRLIDKSPGRTTNVLLSSSKINNTVLPPGGVFSFNQTVGPRTAQSGYRDAKIFAGQKVVTGIGGGICQTSSTIYNAVLEAGLQVLERYPHSMRVAYAPPGRDATISWGSADFKFRNNQDFPIKLMLKVEGGYVFAAMVKAEPEKQASIPSNL
ncbi:Vancomycin resistance VanW [Syntrophomonas zehnderi OL-4]|uniref:Vancomycin resistance VanW n=1 Tax=Syntrophomonas zehnderi OL-4 TaxID=690567 RepID=A0A0E4GA99_9FIRM|nr:VanW family protein [Syntrophomonas zehnderi]CFX26640.1 Vancomycin resistance VanW [Syntrophomonas zehnderi OL-4]